MTGIADCWALLASGHVAAAPATAVMKSRLCTRPYTPVEYFF